ARGNTQPLPPATLIRLPGSAHMRRVFTFLLASVSVLSLTLGAVAQSKHPFTFEDMMKLKRVGEPQVSPDGKWVIFSVVDVSLEANTKTPHIWIAPLSRTEAARSEEKSGMPHARPEQSRGVSPNLGDMGT